MWPRIGRIVSLQRCPRPNPLNLYICYFTPQKGIMLVIRWPAKERALYYPCATNEFTWVQKNRRKDRRVNERHVTVEEEAGDFLCFVIFGKLLYNVVLISAVQKCESVSSLSYLIITQIFQHFLENILKFCFFFSNSTYYTWTDFHFLDLNYCKGLAT